MTSLFKIVNKYCSLALMLMAIFGTPIFSLANDGPSDGGGGGGERLSTEVEIRQALSSIYGGGNFPLQYLGTFQEAANRSQLSSDSEVRAALQAVFNRPGNFRLEGDGDRHADIRVVLRVTCRHGMDAHLASNRRSGVNTAGQAQWEICYSLSELQKYSPSSLISVMIPLHFHEQTEVEGFSHEIALRVQEAVRYRMLLSGVISTSQSLINITDDLLPGGHRRDQYFHADSELSPEQEIERRQREVWIHAGRLTMEWVQLIQAGIIPAHLLTESVDLSNLKFSEKQQLAQRFGRYVQFCRNRPGVFRLDDEFVVRELLKNFTIQELTTYFENVSSFGSVTQTALYSESGCRVEGVTPNAQIFWSGTARALQNGAWHIIHRIEEKK